MSWKDRNFGKIGWDFSAVSPQLRSGRRSLSSWQGNPTAGLDRRLPVNEAGLAVWQVGGQVLMMRSVDVVEIGNSHSFCHARIEDKPRRCAGLALSDRASSRRVPGAGGGGG